jgi:GNAT superfamily N-acetyltransferase
MSGIAGWPPPPFEMRVTEPPISLRPARPKDLAFCRRISHDTMRWIIEGLWGFDETQQIERFDRQWNAAETRIVEVGGEDAGWLQTAPAERAMFLKQIYLDARFQRRRIGTRLVQAIIEEAQRQGCAVILGVVKINPALRLYERLGFRITHEDEFKFYMRREL